jgi:hypothetical protein
VAIVHLAGVAVDEFRTPGRRRKEFSMARSFFAGTDADLYADSMAFSAKINESPETYGLSEQQCVDYAALNAAYASAYRLAIAPATRTRGTVIAKNDAREALRAAASELAKIIGANPDVTSSMKVDLGLNVRAAGSPMGPPGTPKRFRAELTTVGSLKLSWQCDNPRRGAGTIYLISRQAGGKGGFTYIGRSGRRKFEDMTLPVGLSSVTYRVQAVRSTTDGQPADFSVNFGVVAFSRGTDATPVKIAA